MGLTTTWVWRKSWSTTPSRKINTDPVAQTAWSTTRTRWCSFEERRNPS